MSVAYKLSERSVHLIASRFVAQTFRIQVLRPMRRVDETERFPVLYLTDADDLFDGVAALATSLQLHGEAPRFILVGIGYENAGAAALLRWRDFAPREIRRLFMKELRQLAATPLVSQIEDFEEVMERTDAHGFLRFIREELTPLIDHTYLTIPEDRSYFGYSAGGTFGLFALFDRPDTFARYILGSPATSYAGRQFGVDLASAFVGSGRPLDARAFISVGELEEFQRSLAQFDLVSGYYQLGKFLSSTALPGLQLTLKMFPGERHSSAWAPAFSHGVRAVFETGEATSYWLDLLK